MIVGKRPLCRIFFSQRDIRRHIERFKISFQFGILAILALLWIGISDADWAQWRGPNRDGISNETDWTKNWSAGVPKELWRVSIGEGFSGISISQGRAYTMDTQGGNEFVVCFDIKNGEELWRFQSDNFYQEGQGGSGPRATPTIDGDMVFTVSAFGKLYALDTNSGEKLWSHDFRRDFGSKMPQWGYSTSPLVEGELLVVDVGGTGRQSIVAFNKKNGKIVWSSQSDVAGYSSPIAVTVNGIRQLICFTGTQLVAVSPEDGKQYWQYQWKTSYNVNAATPVFISPDKVFISSGYNKGAAAVQISKNGKKVKQLWKNKRMKNHFATCVFHEGYLYGFDNSILKCIEADTGREQWKTRGYGKGTVMLADGHLIILSDSGKLALAEVNPRKFDEKSSLKVLNGRCWTVPTLADGKLYLRSMREMVCLDMGGMVH